MSERRSRGGGGGGGARQYDDIRKEKTVEYIFWKLHVENTKVFIFAAVTLQKLW